jgi:hypothetical protein
MCYQPFLFNVCWLIGAKVITQDYSFIKTQCGMACTHKPIGSEAETLRVGDYGQERNQHLKLINMAA